MSRLIADRDHLVDRVLEEPPLETVAEVPGFQSCATLQLADGVPLSNDAQRDPVEQPPGFSDAPRVDVAEAATVEWDTTPGSPNLSTAGSPNSIESPVRSGYQTATYAIRLVLRGAWRMRGSGLVQYVTGATW